MPSRRRKLISRGDGNIRERRTADGPRFDAKWRDDSGMRAGGHRTKTFATYAEAENFLADVAERKRAGIYVPDGNATVGDILSEYLRHGRARWSPNTYATYRGICERDLLPAIGALPIEQATPRNIQLFMDRFARAYSPSRVGVIRAFLTGAFKEASLLGIVHANPFAGIRTPTVRRRDTVTWQPSHIAAVLAAAKETDDGRGVMWHAFYTVSLLTGMRPGEVRALMWRDVDLNLGVITCRRTITRDESNRVVIGSTTKTHASRVIPLPPSAVSTLDAYQHEQERRRLSTPGWHFTGLVFDRGNGDTLPQATVQRAHARICQSADVPRIRLHDMRHTAATLMLESGVDLKTVSAILGHRDISTTANIYAHVSTDHARSAVVALDEAINRHQSIPRPYRELTSDDSDDTP